MTAWTDYLLRHPDPIDAPDLCSGVFAVALTDFGLIDCAGDDAGSFLLNLFSNDITRLAENGAQWSSFNTPKGRMIANTLIWGEGDRYRLLVSADILPGLLKKLPMYVLRSKVRLSGDEGRTALIGLTGASPEWLARLGFDESGQPLRWTLRGSQRLLTLAEGLRLFVVPEEEGAAFLESLLAAGAGRGGAELWKLAMIRAGLPVVTAGIQEAFVAQTINFDLIGGVRRNKGCYPGQEIVARTRRADSLGKLKKRMFRIVGTSAEMPAPGDEIFAGTEPVGKLVNIARTPNGFEALAVISRSHADAPSDLRLGAPNGVAFDVFPPPYSLPGDQQEDA